MGKRFWSAVAPACLMVTILLSQIGCQADRVREEQPQKSRQEKIENVVRIFLNSSSYTLLVQDQETGEMKLRYVSCYTGDCIRDTRFIPDAPVGQPMSVVVTRAEERGYVTDLVFHVHSAADVGGGTWDHGKNGHGSIHVIE